MKSYDVQHIPLDQIDKNPLNPQGRGEQADIKSLLHSITERGLYYPILVNKTPNNRFVIIEGHRRFAVYELKRGGNPDFAAIPALVLEVGQEYLTTIFRDINETARKLTGKQWLEVAALGGKITDLPTRLAPASKALSALFSPEELRRIARRQGPSVYGMAKRVANACGYTDSDLKKIVSWLVNSGDSVNVRIELKEGRDSNVRKAIETGCRLNGNPFPDGDVIAKPLAKAA